MERKDEPKATPDSRPGGLGKEVPKSADAAADRSGADPGSGTGAAAHGGHAAPEWDAFYRSVSDAVRRMRRAGNDGER